MRKMDFGVLGFILQYAAAPIAAYLFYMYRKQTQKLDELDKRMASVETSTAVIKVMVDNIKDDIREIKHGISKLVDRQ